jgi:hypothetical protein
MMKKLRIQYHRDICEKVLFVDNRGIPNNADKHSDISVALAQGVVRRFDYPLRTTSPSGQTSGNLFEQATANYIEKAFLQLTHLRPGNWLFSVNRRVEEFEQYEHLADLEKTLSIHKELRTILGDYIIKPDIVVGRMPVSDDEINKQKRIIAGKIADLTPLRANNSSNPVLHASISCKWTIRSDRSQNARTEGLNLIRNRKGNTPHIVIVTAEPYPQRIASLALGTGDIDCVYHIALPELMESAREYGNEAVSEMLDILITGKRLRDISDLPFDLAV